MRRAEAVMRAWAVAVALLCLWAMSDGAKAERLSHYAMTQHAIDDYIVPSLGAFETASQKLAAATDQFCAAPDAGKRTALVAGFGEALSAWAQVEVIRTGPATREGRAQRIAFWPDPRGAVERQLRQALAQHQPEVAAEETLRAQSAALQGFPALELLIADGSVDIGGTDEEGRYRCRVATAIAHNIATLAHEIGDGWMRSGGWRDHMLRPGSDNVDYPSAEIAATDIFKSLTTSLQAILEAQLRPLAEDKKDQKPKVGSRPYKRLGFASDYLVSGIRGCHGLYRAAQLAAYLKATDPEQKRFAELVETAFTQAESGLTAKGASGAARSEDEIVQAARVASSMLGGARRIIATKIADAAEIVLGFNELDGD